MDLPRPEPLEREILVQVSVCGVCHTELDEIEGRTPPERFPVVLGHQIIGRVARTGQGATRFQAGDRVGIAWIHHACGTCSFCRERQENLCREFKATGRDADGGYAEYTTVSEDFAYPIPEVFTDGEAAPLLCAGAVGYRSLRLTEMADGDSLGLLGFGASAHLVLKMVQHRFPKSRVLVFSRSPGEREFARELGAAWAGDFHEEPPEKLQRAIDTTPVWRPVVRALEHLERGGGWSSTPSGKRKRTRRRCCSWIMPGIFGWKRRSRAWPTSAARTWPSFWTWPPASPSSRNFRSMH